jgi:hypothetical protein
MGGGHGVRIAGFVVAGAGGAFAALGACGGETAPTAVDSGLAPACTADFDATFPTAGCGVTAYAFPGTFAECGADETGAVPLSRCGAICGAPPACVSKDSPLEGCGLSPCDVYGPCDPSVLVLACAWGSSSSGGAGLLSGSSSGGDLGTK